ncbi:ATP-binding protein [Actinacidiphila acidipaludis]|uniref:ATP-binding protein n=1 Tax=Actinacidiphila acidipaludis TaxID=2873382 RepID=UPI0027E047A5|nr:ATP-binding protein [Streptomyces acidipaludis]
MPRDPDDPDRMTDRRLVGGAVLALLTGVLVWSLLDNGYIPFWREPLTLLTPRGWWNGGGMSRPEYFADKAYDILWMVLLAYYFARLGNWPELLRRYLTTPAMRGWASVVGGFVVWMLCWKSYIPLFEATSVIFPQSWTRGGGNAYAAALVGDSLYIPGTLLIAWPCAKYGQWGRWLRRKPAPAGPPPWPPAPGAVPPAQRTAPGDPFGAVDVSPAEWPELRGAGRHDVADRLAAEVRSGRMNDVDCVRIRHAWSLVHSRRQGADEFADTVLRLGADACLHPSGDRDVPRRAAGHDLLGDQVRIGRGAEDKRNGYQYRGSGIALYPAVLGTGLLAVGPAGSGKTRQVMRPVAESLCLQALGGRAAVVAVAAAEADLGPREAYDVVISLGDPASRYDLDLYGGTTDPDLAAWLLADALVDGPESEQLRAATALGQLLGPYAAAHGHFPPVPVLRELLDGVPHAYAALREAVDAAGAPGLMRELDARERQAARPGDIGSLLADRVATLDRPAFAGFFDTSGRSRPFSMDALAHPLRVRIELPERGHSEASRILVRLLLAQFMATVASRRDSTMFACIVVDDAAHAVTPATVRALSSLRAANAGAVLGLRTLDDIPEQLRGPLVGSIGCRMALAGVSPWDGGFFAEAWGTTTVQTRDVTRTPDQSGGMARRASRGVRRLFTGEAVTTESVTVREVERERWSASDLAHGVPAGHAVVSMTTTGGEHAPPVLVDLRA